MTYEPRSVTSQDFLWQVDCVSIEYYQIERPTKLNASPNWMAHQSEWLTFKLNDSSSNGPPNWMAHYWMIHFHYRMTHCALNAGPNARSLVYTRRQSIAGEIFFKFGGVTVFRVFPCFVYPRTQNSCVFGFPSGKHGILFWISRGPKIVSCSRQKVVIKVNSRTWGYGWWRKVFILFWSIGMKLNLLIVILTGTLAGSKRQFS